MRELAASPSELWEQTTEEARRRPSCASESEEGDEDATSINDLFRFFDEGKPPSETATLQSYEIE